MGSRLRDLSQHGPRGVRLLRVWGEQCRNQDLSFWAVGERGE